MRYSDNVTLKCAPFAALSVIALPKYHFKNEANAESLKDFFRNGILNIDK